MSPALEEIRRSPRLGAWIEELRAYYADEQAARRQRDRGIKFEDFAAHGTAEYWIVDPIAERIEQYLLKDGSYERVANEGGVVRSAAVAGFELPERALFDTDAFLEAVGRFRPRS